MYRFYGTWSMNWYTKWHQIKNIVFQCKLLYNNFATNRMLYVWGIHKSQLCRFCCEESFIIIRLLVLVLPTWSLFLVAGSGMAEQLQHLIGANSANSTAGWIVNRKVQHKYMQVEVLIGWFSEMDGRGWRELKKITIVKCTVYILHWTKMQLQHETISNILLTDEVGSLRTHMPPHDASPVYASHV